MSSTIEDRVILLLKYKAGTQSSKHGFWERLGKLTNTASKRWRNVYARDQRVTSDMLESLAKMFPQYAFWLVTGITDAVNGHIAPMNAQTFPERLYAESIYSDSYFKQSLILSELLYENCDLNLDNDDDRLNAYLRTSPFAYWWESDLCKTAYNIATTDDYKYLDELRTQREIERAKAIDYITKPNERPWIKKQAKIETTFSIDPRSQHQDSWDLFYKPIKEQDTSASTHNDNQAS